MFTRSRIATTACAVLMALGTVATAHAGDDVGDGQDVDKLARDEAQEAADADADVPPLVVDHDAAIDAPSGAPGASDGPSNRVPNVAGTNGSSCGFPTIEAAIGAVTAGGTVYIAPGTHPAQNGVTNYNIVNNVTLEGATSNCRPKANADPSAVVLRHGPGAGSDAVLEIGQGGGPHIVAVRNLTLDGNNVSSVEGVVFVQDVTAHDVTFDNVVIQNGNNPDATYGGGGLRIGGIGTQTPVVQMNNSHVVDNVAIEGGGIWSEGAILNIGAYGASNSPCKTSQLAVDRYCSEIRGNDATNGGGLHAENSNMTVDQTAFIGNTETNGAAAIDVAGASVAMVSSVMLIGHDNNAGADGAITVNDSSTIAVIDVTSVDGANWWFDDDTGGAKDISRTIADTSGQFGATTGSCNLSVVPTGLPGSIQADPQFVTTARSAYVPRAMSPAVDACSGGAFRDVFNSPVRNGDGLPSGTEHDIGAIESPTGTGFKCGGLPATIVGTPGADTINGKPVSDVIVGHAGNDVINGRGGGDIICAGAGNDTVNGNGGNDTVFGHNGVDRINGDAGNDKLLGNAGNDRIDGSHGNDAINGNGGQDILRGGGSNDVINGSGGNDSLRGDAGRDNLRGGPGSDFLNGGPGGPDRCNGQAGSDNGGGGCEITISIP